MGKVGIWEDSLESIQVQVVFRLRGLITIPFSTMLVSVALIIKVKSRNSPPEISTGVLAGVAVPLPLNWKVGQNGSTAGDAAFTAGVGAQVGGAAAGTTLVAPVVQLASPKIGRMRSL